MKYWLVLFVRKWRWRDVSGVGGFSEGAVKSNTRRYFWTGTIVTKAGASYEFGAKEIVKGVWGILPGSAVGVRRLNWGRCGEAEMGITLLSDIDRYTLEDAQVTLWCFIWCWRMVRWKRFADGDFLRSARRTGWRSAWKLKAYWILLRFDAGVSMGF